jgi:SAM-dependent methyltransferase
MYERHTNRDQYFKEQVVTTRKYVIPFLEEHIKINTGTSVLEIGCGEGGNLKPFMDSGCTVTGIDLSAGKIKLAHEFFRDHPNYRNLILICEDIYRRSDLGTFDVVVLRDVIEHIPDQKRFMGYMKHFLHFGSVVFFGFPPWQNPFGGHQQMCRSRILSKLPWFHLLPGFFYKGVLKLFGEPQNKIQGLMEVKETGISIERFERILKNHGFRILTRRLYLFNPNYEVKFKVRPRKQNRFVAAVPWLRNFFTTAGYYLVTTDDQ